MKTTHVFHASNEIQYSKGLCSLSVLLSNNSLSVLTVQFRLKSWSFIGVYHHPGVSDHVTFSESVHGETVVTRRLVAERLEQTLLNRGPDGAMVNGTMTFRVYAGALDLKLSSCKTTKLKRQSIERCHMFSVLSALQ